MWEIKWWLQFIFGHVCNVCSCHLVIAIHSSVQWSYFQTMHFLSDALLILQFLKNTFQSYEHAFPFAFALFSRRNQQPGDRTQFRCISQFAAFFRHQLAYHLLACILSFAWPRSHCITSTDVQCTTYDFGFHSGSNMEARRTDHTKWNSFDVTWPFDTDNSIIQHLNRLIVFIVVLICPDDWIVVHFGWIRNDWSQSTTIDISLAIAFGYAYNWPNVIGMRLNKWNIYAHLMYRIELVDWMIHSQNLNDRKSTE